MFNVTDNSKSILCKVLWLIVIVGIFVRFYEVFHFNPIDNIFSDPARYWYQATTPLAQEGILGIEAIGYPIWLSIVARLTLGNPLAVVIYAGLMSIITPFVWYLFLRELLPTKLVSLIGYAIFTWLPSWIGIFSYFMSETLFLPLLGLALYVSILSFKKKKFSLLIILTLLWIAVSFTRLVALPLAIFCTFYALAKSQNKIKNSIAVVSIWMFCLIPAAFRTHELIGAWAPFGYTIPNQIYMQSGKNIVSFNIQNDFGTHEVSLYSPSVPHSGSIDILPDWIPSREGNQHFIIDARKGDSDWNIAQKESRVSTGNFIWLWFENIILLLFGHSFPDMNQTHFWERMTSVFRWIWAPLLFVVTVNNFIFCIKRKYIPFIIFITMMMWTICLVSPAAVMEGRYRKPLEGLLIVNGLWLLVFVPKAKKKIVVDLKF